MSVNNIASQKTIQEIIQSSNNNSSSRNTGALGKDDFLNLLVTQLKYQDPLKPLEDKEFIAQMAQFSSLEQMQNMNSTITQSQAFSLLGKSITANVSDADTKQPKIVNGFVTNVKITNGKTFAVVNGEDISIDRITDVTEADSINKQTNLSAYTNLIGYNVSGAVYNPVTSNIVPVKGMVSALEKGTHEDYAVVDNVTVDISGVVTDTPQADSEFIKKYLDARMPSDESSGMEVELWAVDRKSKEEVPVKAILKDYTINEAGKYIVTLDRVYIPVDSVSKITK